MSPMGRSLPAATASRLPKSGRATPLSYRILRVSVSSEVGRDDGQGPLVARKPAPILAMRRTPSPPERRPKSSLDISKIPRFIGRSAERWVRRSLPVRCDSDFCDGDLDAVSVTSRGRGGSHQGQGSQSRASCTAASTGLRFAAVPSTCTQLRSAHPTVVPVASSCRGCYEADRAGRARQLHYRIPADHGLDALVSQRRRRMSCTISRSIRETPFGAEPRWSRASNALEKIP